MLQRLHHVAYRCLDAAETVDFYTNVIGLKLAHAIRTRWPPIELIVTSGHFNLSDADMPERGRFFPKPYRDRDIVSAIRHFVT